MATPNPLPNREEELTPHLNETQSASATTPTVESRPFVMPSRAGGSGGKDKTSKMLMIAGAILVLLVGFFGFISTKGTNKKKAGADAAGKPNLGRIVTHNTPGQLVPADKMAVQNSTVKTGSLEANDIEKTKSPKLGGLGAPGTSSSAGKAPAPGSRTLADVAPFQQPDTDPEHLKNWSPEAYPGTSRPNNGQEVQVAQKELEEYSKPSMIFVAHETNGTARSSLQLHAAPDNFGLESGFHVAARLESMASTRIHTRGATREPSSTPERTRSAIHEYDQFLRAVQHRATIRRGVRGRGRHAARPDISPAVRVDGLKPSAINRRLGSQRWFFSFLVSLA